MPTPKTEPDDVALSLTLAVVTAAPSPLLLLDGAFTVIAASTSFHLTFGSVPTDVAGQSFYALFREGWDVPELRRLLDATVAGDLETDDCELDLKLVHSRLRHLIIQARRLDYLDGPDPHPRRPVRRD